jgi:uncharacterized protein (DUF342 family)
MANKANAESLTETQEIYLAQLESGDTPTAIAENLGVTVKAVYEMTRTLKDVILDRARERLAGASLKAVNTVIASLDADASTEKGELRLKAAEQVMDRVGLTKHTSVEVQVESENGIFILPGKALVAAEEPEED